MFGSFLPQCVGCGYCCRKAPCVLGEEIPCKELVHRDGRYWCGLVLNAEGEDREMLEIDLYIGDGCCSSFNTDRKNMINGGPDGEESEEETHQGTA